ncbi:MAG: hypothetical protein KG028_10330 [Actinobacteria bacterium]|nr:hypothetical protein [Actinomycetota bacterium]
MPPRFSPRDLVTPPEAFWNDEVDGVWAAPRSSEEAEQLLVAYYLSQVSRNVAAVLREVGWTRGDLADAIGEDARNLRRKVNGEYPAMFEDVLRWALALDRPDIVYAPNSTAELAPTGMLDQVREGLGWDRT